MKTSEKKSKNYNIRKTDSSQSNGTEFMFETMKSQTDLNQREQNNRPDLPTFFQKSILTNQPTMGELFDEKQPIKFNPDSGTWDKENHPCDQIDKPLGSIR